MNMNQFSDPSSSDPIKVSKSQLHHDNTTMANEKVTLVTDSDFLQESNIISCGSLDHCLIQESWMRRSSSASWRRPLTWSIESRIFVISLRSQRDGCCGARDEGEVEGINDFDVFITGASQEKAVGVGFEEAICVELVQPLHALIAPFKPTFAIDHMGTKFCQNGRQSFGSHLEYVDKPPSQTS
ncbi:hypothetical protein ACLOJK_002990 [Asimina triloba]